MKALRRASFSMALPVAAVAGCSALLLRPVDHLSAVTVGLIGVAGLLPRQQSAGTNFKFQPMWWLFVVLAGSSVFWVGAARGPSVGAPLDWLGVATILIAAVGEEAFFRRFLYGWLARFGIPVAIGITTVLFALIHVPIYGFGVLPINLAAGALLGWQRYATGDWTAPAVTHMLANLMQMGW